MIPQNFTHKSQEALRIAHEIAMENGQPSLEPIHLFLALLQQEDGVVPAIVNKLSVDLPALVGQAEELLAALPKTANTLSGGLGQMYLTPAFTKTLENAERATKQFKDDYISTEHLLLALAENRDGSSDVLAQHGVTVETILHALKDVRGNVKVD